MVYPATGYNGGVAQTASDPDTVRLRTTWAPRFVQPRVRPLDYPGVVRRMRVLSTATDVAGLSPIVNEFKRWIAALPGQIDPTEGAASPAEADREEAAFALHLKQWEQEAASIASGIALLEEARQHWKKSGQQADPLAIPFEAWRALKASS